MTPLDYVAAGFLIVFACGYVIGRKTSDARHERTIRRLIRWNENMINRLIARNKRILELQAGVGLSQPRRDEKGRFVKRV